MAEQNAVAMTLPPMAAWGLRDWDGQTKRKNVRSNCLPWIMPIRESGYMTCNHT